MIKNKFKIWGAIIIVIILIAPTLLSYIGIYVYKSGNQQCYHTSLNESIFLLEGAKYLGCTDYKMYRTLSQAYFWEDEDKEKREKFLSEALKHYPLDIYFLDSRADMRKELKQYEKAYEDYDKIVKIDSTYEYISSIIYARGAMQYLLGDTIEANLDRETAKLIKGGDLRLYSDYCRLWD
jgi:tetratricopeptide (TPR) repeat protein